MAVPHVCSSINRADDSAIGGVAALGDLELLQSSWFDLGCASPRDTPCIPFEEFMYHGEYRNYVLYCIDYPEKRYIFLEVVSLEKLYEEPFLDRGIRKLATGKAYCVPFGVAREWTLDQDLSHYCLLFVWNTGRCGSTLMHRALLAAGVASLTEPMWFDQLCAPWFDFGCKNWPDASEIMFDCHVVDWAVSRRLRPEAKILALNPKAMGFKGFKIIHNAFPCSKWNVQHIWMYRDPRDVVESFGSIRFRDQIPPKATDILPTAAISSKLKANLKAGKIDASHMPKQSDFNKNMSFDWADQFLFVQELASRKDLKRKIVTVGFDAFTSKDLQIRKATLTALFDLIGLPRKAVDVGLVAFDEDSQKGTRMALSSAKTKKYYLDETGRAEIEAWVIHLTGCRLDSFWPHSVEKNRRKYSLLKCIGKLCC